MMNNTQKIYEGGEWEFILEHPVKIIDVVRGYHNGKLIIRVLREDGDDKPIFLIQKVEENNEEKDSDKT